MKGLREENNSLREKNQQLENKISSLEFDNLDNTAGDKTWKYKEYPWVTMKTMLRQKTKF